MTNSFTDYTVAEELTWHELSHAVTKLLEGGWIPQGGVSVMESSSSETGHLYCQALVR